MPSHGPFLHNISYDVRQGASEGVGHVLSEFISTKILGLGK